MKLMQNIHISVVMVLDFNLDLCVEVFRNFALLNLHFHRNGQY